MSHRIITANRIRDGAVVWRAADGRWSLLLADAAPLVPEAAERELATAKADVARRLVCDVAAVEATLVDGRPVPDRLRERLRAAGPSVRPDLAHPNALPTDVPR